MQNIFLCGEIELHQALYFVKLDAFEAYSDFPEAGVLEPFLKDFNTVDI